MSMKRIAAGLVSMMLLASGIGCTTSTTTTTRSLTMVNSEAEKKNNRAQALNNYVQLGIGYLTKGERSKARFNFRKALEIDERSAPAHSGLALLYQFEKENELAEQHFRKALQYDPEHTMGRNNFAVFLYRLERYEEAHALFTEVVADVNYPRRARAYVSLGLAAERLGRIEEAKQAWDKAITLDSRMTKAHIELAEVYFREGDLPRAKRHLDQHRRLTGPTARALWLAIRVERGFGNKDGEASKALALEELFPYSQEYLEYKEWLQQI